MIRIALKAREVRELESALRRADDPRFARRVQAVLMTHRGRPRDDVAADLGVAPRTVQRHLNAYLDRGLDGLRPRKSAGPARRLTDDLADEVRAWVEAGPAACGLSNLANWTFEALADHLARTRGVRVRKSAMHAFCRRHGVRPYRPTYRYLRGDPAKQAAAARELAALKKTRNAGG
jgi:transposase